MNDKGKRFQQSSFFRNSKNRNEMGQIFHLVHYVKQQTTRELNQSKLNSSNFQLINSNSNLKLTQQIEENIPNKVHFS